MSDEALAWKIAFGALVLAFCGVAWFMRAPAHPVELAKGAPAAPAPASPPLPPFEVIPPDIPEVQDTTEAKVETRPAAPKKPAKRNAARRVPPSKVHLVKHRTVASPYAAGRKHYPFEPKDRWRNGYA